MASPSNGTGIVRKVLSAAAHTSPRVRPPKKANGHLRESPLATDQRQFLAMLEYAQGLGNEQTVAEKYGLERSQVDSLVKTYKKNLPKQLGTEIAIADQTRAMWGISPLTPYNPSELVNRKGLKIFDKMRKDDQIKAALGFKKLAVLATGYEISPPKDKDAEWEPVKFVSSVLEQVEGTIVQILFDVMTALDYGYSVSEKVFQLIESGEWKNKIGYKAIKTRAPHSIYFETDDYGNLKDDGVHQWQKGTDKALDPNKFVIYSYQREFGNWYGRSDLEAVYRSWWIKENSYRWLAMLLERFGIPPIFALYNPSRMSQQQIDSLQSVVEKIQAATAGAIPRPTPEDLEMWAPELAGQTNAVFVPAITMLNHDIARGLLMPGLLGATPDQSQGSMARANVHFDVFMLVINYLRDTIETSIMQEQIIIPLCDLNFPNLEEYPQFKFLPLEEEVKADLLTLWDKMTTTGTVHKQDADEDHIRELLKFPELDRDNMQPAPGEPGGPPAPGQPALGPDGKPVPEAPKPDEPGQNKPKPGFDKQGNPLPKEKMDAEGIPATVSFMNPNHEPAGSSKGGQFAPTDSAAVEGHYEKWSSRLSRDEVASLVAYTTVSEGINSALRKGRKPGKGLQGQIDGIDSAIAQSAAPRNMTVFRGINDAKLMRLEKKFAAGKISLAEISSQYVGKALVEKGYTSTSVYQDTGRGFGDIAIEIRVPKGTPAAYLAVGGTYNDVMGNERHSLIGPWKEQEVLLPRNSKFIVRAVHADAKNNLTLVMDYVRRR